MQVFAFTARSVLQSMPSIRARSAAMCAVSALRPYGVSEIHVVRRPRWTPLWRLR